MDTFAWMAWTGITAGFFTGIGLALLAMTVAELRWPSAVRRGFLPMLTSRGDRFFVGLLSSAFVHLAWIGLTAWPLVPVSVACALWLAALLRWG